MQDIDWNNLKFVLAVARSNSIAQAARKLAVNETTVSRHLGNLESQLGTKLFERLNGGLRSTEAGQLAVDSAERVELETLRLQNTIFEAEQQITGTVRLTTVPIVLNHILVPALSTLAAKHPDLSLQLIADSRDLSLTNRQADIALRLARPTKELRTLARKIGQLDYAAYFSRSGNPKDMRWISFEESMKHLPQAEVIRNLSRRNKEPVSSITVNDGESMLACARAGTGKVLLPVVIGDSDPGLIRVEDKILLTREVWIMVHPDLRQLARVKEVINWLQDLI